MDFDKITGGPKQIVATGKFLTPAAEKPAAVVVSDFVDTHRGLFGHNSQFLTAGNARLAREDVSAHNGLVTMVWQQELEGIPLFQTVLRANVTKHGELVTLGGSFLSNPAEASGKDRRARADLVAEPPVTAKQAVALAAANVDAAVDESAVMAKDGPQGAEQKQGFDAPALSDVQAALVWVPTGPDRLQLAWDVILTSLQHGEMFRSLVDVESGEVLVRHGLTDYISPASYRVYAKTANSQPYDSPTPMSPGHATPLTTQPPTVARPLITLDALSTTASPDGWIPDGGTQTLGNNVDAHADTNADNSPDLPRPTSATRSFDFPIDFASAPSAYKDAAVTQLFYLNNWIHDQLYGFGFTESSGNFQTNNFSRGGTGNDAVQADAQDGSGTNNANFSTPPDGSPGRMQMYVFTGPTPDIDGDLDAEIVIHEYCHGLSNRLVGGGVGLSANQSRGMGEGWSDFYGLALLAEPGDDINGNYAAGGYATRQFSGLTQNYYFGIRRYPYSTDLLKNPLTFRDIDPSQASTHAGVPRSSIIGSTADEVHNMGEVWCVTLWDLRANLVTKHGFAIGNQLTLQLVTDGMKLSPVNPNFLQARDGIIQADLVNNSGANQGELWSAFAKRGMGASATSPSSSSTAGLVESFDIPDKLAVAPFGSFAATGQVGGTISPASQVFTLNNTGTTPLNWTASKSQPWLTLSSTGGTLAAGTGTAVTVTFNAATSNLTTGTYTDTIIFRNTSSDMSFNRPVSLVIEPIYVPVYSQTFESGSLGSEWAITGTGTHRTVVTTANAPFAGTYHLTMDSSVTGYSRNEATLTLNLAGRNHLALTFQAKMFNDEAHAPPTNPFTGGADFDGIAVSTDGGTIWHEIRALRTLSNTWQKVAVDLDAELAARGLSYTANFKIRFNHYDNYAISTDGFAFDNILVAEMIDRSLTIAMGDEATEGDGPMAATVTITPSPQADVTVALASSRPDATVPPSVTVPAGGSSAGFNVTPVNDALLDGTQAVIITASAANYPSGTKAIAIHDNETATLSLDLPASVIEGSSPATGLVETSAPVDQDVVVALEADHPSLQVPPTVTIPAGTSSAQFSLVPVNDGQINGSRSVSVSAAVRGWNAGAENITVLDDEIRALSLTLPAMREGDSGKTATLGLSGTLANDLTVAFESSDTSELTVPATITVSAGKAAVTVPLTIVNDTEADGSQPVVVTVTAAGFPSITASGDVADNDAHHFTVAPIAGPVLRNAQVAVTVTAKDIGNATITNFSQAVSFTAKDGGLANVPVTPESASNFTNGVLPTFLSFGAYGSGVVLTATDSGGHTGSSNAFNVVSGPPDHFTWSTIPSPQYVDAPFPVTIRAVDGAGNPTTSFVGPANLVANLPGTVEVLTWTLYADISATGEYVHTKQAIASQFTNFNETSTNVTDPAALAAALVGKHVFLIVEQESSNSTTLGPYATAWATVLNNFVNAGGTVIACSNTTNEHLFLTNSGLLALTPVTSQTSATVTKPAETPLNAGVAAPFSGSYLHTYTTTNGTVDLNADALPVVISRNVGTGRVVMIGTDFFTTGTGMDRVIANAVALAAPPGSLGIPVSPAVTTTFVNGEWTGAVSLPIPVSSAWLSATSASISGTSNPFSVITTPLPSSAVFTEDFESGSLDPARWTSTGTGNFRTQVTTANSPHGGSRHMTMDTSSGAARNEATVTLDLAGRSGVVLQFWAVGYNDESNGPPASPFTTGADFDGVAISANGTTWWEVRPLRSLSGTYRLFTVDLDAAIAARGISYNSAFKIRFNQYDDNPLTTDGIGIDDIVVTAASSPGSLVLSLPSPVMEGAGLVQGSVSSSVAASNNLVVTLTSKSAAKISVPASVIIPAGQTSATFAMNVRNDAFRDGTKNVIITAAAAAQSEVHSVVEVTDNDGGVLGLTIPATTLENGGNLTGTLSLSAPALIPLPVSITSDRPTAALPSATVTVAAGATTAPFSITIPDDTVVDGDQPVQLTASLSGWTTATAGLTVVDNESRQLSLTVPSVFREADPPKTGTVSLAGTAATNLVITLVSSAPSRISAPSTVTIQAGQSSATFLLTAVDNSVADGPQPFTITASAATFITASAGGTIRDNEAHHFTFEPFGSPQLKNGPVPAIVTARDAFEGVVKEFNGIITLTANSDSGPLVVSPATAGGFVNGVWNGSVQIDALATNVVLTASDGQGHTGSSTAFNLVDGAINRFEWNGVPSLQTLDTPFAATLRATDAAGATITNYNGIANLFAVVAADDPVIGNGTSSMPYPIMTATHDSRANVIYTAAEVGRATTISGLSLNVVSKGAAAETLTNWTIRLKHTSLTVPSSTSAWDNAGWTTVYRASPVISSTGWVTFPFTTPFEFNGINNLLIDFSMDRTATTSSYTYVQSNTAAASMTRYGTSNSTNGDPLTWSGTTPTPDLYYQRADIRFTTSREVPLRPPLSGTFVNGTWAGEVSVPIAQPGVTLKARAGAIQGSSNSFLISAPPPPADGGTVVFAEDFESGILNPARWTSTGTGNFRTQVTGSYQPHGGTWHLAMDTISGAARNEPTLTLDLAGRSGVVLKFWAAGYGDEAHGPPTSPFTTGANFDGVAISADGTTWWEVQGLRSLPSTYGQFTVDLDAAIASRGIAYNSAFKIRFNQYDDNSLTTDGIVIDDIAVTATAVSGFSITGPAQLSESAAPATGTVTLDAPAADSTVVALISSAPAKLIVPVSTTVAAGQTVATFAITAVDDSIADGNRTVYVSGTVPGKLPRSLPIDVIDNDTPPLALSIPATLAEGTSGQTGTLTLGTPVAGAVTINLSSSDTAELTVPASATLSLGQTTTVFPITVINDSRIDGTRPVTITAVLPGGSETEATAQVTDNETSTLTQFSFGSIYEGNSGTSSLSISGTLPSDLIVSLTSSPAGLLTHPATVIIPAGQTSASYTVSAVDDTLHNGTRTCTVTASATGFTSGSDSGSVRDNDVHHFEISSIASVQKSSVPFSVSLYARDINNTSIGNFSGAVTISAAGDGGSISVTPATATFSSGTWSGSLTCMAAGTNVRITVTVTGVSGISNAFEVQLSPIIAAAPASISLTLDRGTASTRTLAIQNNGGGTLTWNIASTAVAFSEEGESAVAPALAQALANLNENAGLVTAAIPNRYAFTEGVTGTSISDGGGDMYDGGNMLSTNLGTYLAYSDNIIATSTLLGSGGKYFTRKYNGLWVFAADIAGLSYFDITGNLGADGSGTTDSTVLSLSRNGSSYKGFVKRVYGAGDPSVNHLVIVEDNGSVSHTSATDTDSDDHRINGLSGVTRIYNLLYAGTSGAYIDNTAALNVMITFIDAVTISPWVSATPGSGSVTAGSAQNVTLSVSAANLTAGSYTRALVIASNDPATPQISVPVSLTVIDPGVLSVTPGTSLTFSGGQGGPFLPVSATCTLTNTGGESLSWTASSSATWITLSPANGTLAPGATATVTAALQSPAAGLSPGDFNSTLTFTNTTSGRGNTIRDAVLSVLSNLMDSDGDKLPDGWESSYGLNPAGTSGHDGGNGDPDGDGISNFFEYAFGLHPQLRNSSGLPSAEVKPGVPDGKKYLTFQYRRRIQRPLLQYVVETSVNANSWNSSGFQELSAEPVGDGITEVCTVQVNPSTELAARKFVRLKVTSN